MYAEIGFFLAGDMNCYLVYLDTLNIYNNSSKIFNFWITKAFVQFSFIKMWSPKTLMGIYSTMYVNYVLDENFVKNMNINHELSYAKNEGK